MLQSVSKLGSLHAKTEVCARVFSARSWWTERALRQTMELLALKRSVGVCWGYFWHQGEERRSEGNEGYQEKTSRPVCNPQVKGCKLSPPRSTAARAAKKHGVRKMLAYEYYNNSHAACEYICCFVLIESTTLVNYWAFLHKPAS